jgi:uncharacterized protein YndB with AHSA1/START domain
VTDLNAVHIGRVTGSLRAIDDRRGAVRMEDVFDTDAADLWDALTDPQRLARWIADVEGDLRVGGVAQARFTSGWEGPGRIEACEPPHHLVARMSPGTADETVIEATITPEGSASRLVVEERGIPLTELAGHGAGWHAHIEDLRSHLEHNQSSQWATRWAELTPEYQDLAIAPYSHGHTTSS